MATRFHGWTTGLFALALLASGWAFPPAAAEAGAWAFETVGSVPAGCSGPTVRLSGFDQDDQERLVAGWQESSGCGGPITFRWARAEAGAWAVNTIVDHTCTSQECIGLPAASAGPLEPTVDATLGCIEICGGVSQLIRWGVDAIWCAVIAATSGEPC